MFETREELHAAIDAMLDKGQIAEDGGWALVEPEDVSELDDIITGLIDLRVSLDSDGDRTVVPYLINRRIYQADVITYPYEPESDNLSDWIEWQTEMSHGVQHAIAVSETMSRTLTAAMQYRVKKIVDRQNTQRDSVLKFEQAIESRDYDTASGLAIELFGRDFADPLVQRAYHAARLKMGEQFPEQLESAIQQIHRALLDFKDDLDPLFGKLVRTPRSIYAKIFGEAFIMNGRIRDLSMRIEEEGRDIRAKRRATEKEARAK